MQPSRSNSAPVGRSDAGIARGLHGVTKGERRLDRGERLIGSSTSGKNDIAIAEQAARQALVDRYCLDFAEKKLDRAGGKDADFHQDPLVGHDELRGLALDEPGEQPQERDCDRYPRESVPGSVKSDRRDSYRYNERKQDWGNEELPVKASSIEHALTFEQIGVDVAHGSLLEWPWENYTSAG